MSGGRDEPDTDDIIAHLAGPTDWHRIARADAPDRWRALRDWVHWLVGRYGLDARIVPPCWYLHPPLVDLLTALCDQHRGAHHSLAPAGAPTAWQIALWQLEPRLREYVSRTGCSRDTHRDEPPISWPEDPDRWKQHLKNDTAQRR